MGKNEKKALSMISPLYAATQGTMPGIMGVGASALKTYKDRQDEEKMLRGGTTTQEKVAAGDVVQMKAGGRVKSIDGCATRGKTKGRVC